MGSLGISELPIFLLAPIVFLLDYRELKVDGFLPFVWLTISVCVGCCISSFFNSTPRVFFLKGLAHPYALFALTVVLHHFLRRDLSAMKYYLIGVFISSIICIFIFQQETWTAVGADIAKGAEATERVVGNPLFWSSKIKALLVLPISIAYMRVPVTYSVIVPIACAILAMFCSGESGRSAAAVAMLSSVLLCIGGKKRARIKMLGKHIGLVVLICGGAVLLLKNGYSYAASSGMLGYKAKEKYEQQTERGKDILHMLMTGRMELFCGVMACLDHPILGFGPKAEDTGGYVSRYLEKYGRLEDYQSFMHDQRTAARRGEYRYVAIPSHSYISFFWIYYGIIGLILWCYVLFLIWRYLKLYAPAIPQWYGYVVLTIPGEVWNIFFSTFGGRTTTPFLISCILLARAVYKRKLFLPYEMELESLELECGRRNLQ